MRLPRTLHLAAARNHGSGAHLPGIPMRSPRSTARHAAVTMACVLGLATANANAGDFNFGGKVFADTSRIEQNDQLAHADNSDTDVDLKRLYLNADYVFDANWTAHLTTDVNWLRGHREPDVWLRQLYLQRKLGSGTEVRIGVDDMPMMTLTSNWWGYRYLDSLGASMAKLDTIADWGVHVQSKLAQGVDLAVSVVSGSGYKEPAIGRRADVEAVLSWQPTKHTVLAVGGYDGQLGADDATARPLRHTARRLDLMAAYADDTWRFGVRYTYGSNWADLYGLRGDSARDVSAWASLRVASHWSVFARHDRTDSSVLVDPTRRSRYTNAGVEWRPCKRLRLALVFKHTAQDRTGNLIRSGNEAGVWSEWTF